MYISWHPTCGVTVSIRIPSDIIECHILLHIYNLPLRLKIMCRALFSNYPVSGFISEFILYPLLLLSSHLYPCAVCGIFYFPLSDNRLKGRTA